LNPFAINNSPKEISNLVMQMALVHKSGKAR
jgi:hypothetical protein